MNSFTKKLFTIALLFSIVHVAFADRGVGKKSKNKIILNITTPFALKNSIAFNIKSGLTYRGSLLTSRETISNYFMNSSILTYQKGNTIYIIPYKHKIAMPEIRQGYTGMKLIIQSH